ncbi:hypothetical protein HMPREF0454_03965 [Hafnia alvei ATCC 51873]|uniref:Uncharacterized protein n=1 Tax=Hafnia alvei ATCC 51873 TaxID=1002364 RepID=G9YBI4_HAFAL|nr:hypothetical protein HMPREF0454_03965 [Hafnia alvei ATCC 51873]
MPQNLSPKVIGRSGETFASARLNVSNSSMNNRHCVNKMMAKTPTIFPIITG